jgi:Ca-activated chloride channel family protein
MQLKVNVKADRNSYAYGSDPLAHLMIEFDVPALQATDLPTLPVDLIMVLDLSGSMDTEDKYPLLLRAVDTLCANLARKDRVGFIGFSNRSETILHLSAAEALGNSARRNLLHSIERCSIKFGGNTLLAPALMRGLEMLQAEDGKERVQRIYCLTDGDIHDAAQCSSLVKELDGRSASIQFSFVS